MFPTPERAIGWVAIVVFIAVLSLTDSVSAAHKHGITPLVDAAWVATHSGNPGVVVLDAGSRRYAYNAGHIPGAVFTDYERSGWRVTRGGTPGMLPEIAALEKLIGGYGIGNDDRVIIVAPGYNASDMGIATRTYWTFKVLGHDNVSILDGGMKSYLAAGHPLSRDPVTPTNKLFKAAFDTAPLATQDDVRKALAENGHLIDNRPPRQFSGANKTKAAKRFGTIPGAKNAPAIVMTKNGGGQFLDNKDLATLFSDGGTSAADDIITFCNTGHWASIGWFVQSELMGRKNIRLYDGSIAEWSRDPANPILRETN